MVTSLLPRLTRQSFRQLCLQPYRCHVVIAVREPAPAAAHRDASPAPHPLTPPPLSGVRGTLYRHKGNRVTAPCQLRLGCSVLGIKSDLFTGAMKIPDPACLPLISSLTILPPALAGVAPLVGRRPVHGKVVGLIPSQDPCQAPSLAGGS